jgi:hypothetical protein
MYIREIVKNIKKQGKSYRYVQHRLVESIRIDGKPRQHTVLNLGTLEIPKEHHKILANLIEAKLTGVLAHSLFKQVDNALDGLAQHFTDIIVDKRLRDAKKVLDEETSATEEEHKPLYVTIDAASTTSSGSRTIGTENIALSQVRQLGLFEILQECLFTEKEQKQAVAQICARMVHPSSERETARWLRHNSAMTELLDTDFSHISDQTLHRITDKLFAHREYIEKRLCENTTDLFSLDNKLFLYDLTNTYFESPKRDSSICEYTKSKEKRNDCPAITLALVVDGMGFPKRSAILEGNISEPDTLWDVLKSLEIIDIQGNGPRTVVIDAGIATEENLSKLRADPRYEYVAISRKKKFTPELVFDTQPHVLTVNRGKELTVTTQRRDDEVFMLCKSPDRAAKDEAIHMQRRKRFETELTALNKGLSRPRARNKSTAVYERIGRLKERYKVGAFYTIAIKESQGTVSKVTWEYRGDIPKKPGEYIIRTSRKDLPDEDISLVHRTLTMIESAFRWLKSELGLRPNYHVIDKRVVGHAWISVLAYFILAPILNRLEWGGEFVSSSDVKQSHTPWDKPYGWRGLVETMQSQTRVTTSMNCKDGGRMDIRTTLEPNSQQLDIYRRLKINPRPLKRTITRET